MLLFLVLTLHLKNVSTRTLAAASVIEKRRKHFSRRRGDARFRRTPPGTTPWNDLLHADTRTQNIHAHVRATTTMQVLETAIAGDRGRRIAGQVGLDVMKQLIAAKSNQRVLAVYRLLRVRGYIGRGNQNRARVTTMATCYGARAAEVGRGGPDQAL